MNSKKHFKKIFMIFEYKLTRLIKYFSIILSTAKILDLFLARYTVRCTKCLRAPNLPRLSLKEYYFKNSHLKMVRDGGMRDIQCHLAKLNS